MVFVLLRLVLDRSDEVIRLVDPLGPALAAAAVGALVWRYHSVLTAARSERMRETGLLLASGVALIAAASGVGVVVNAALGFAETTLAGTGTRTLLLGGISALAVGGAVWWRAWQPANRAAAGRRIYLVAIFGISAVVALIALLVVGYQVFEYLLDPERSGNLIGRIRAPLGLLTATALVAAYHYSVWRRERATLPPDAGPVQEVEPVQEAGPLQNEERSIGQVVLVTGSDPVLLTHAIRAATGADVTVWLRSGPAAGQHPASDGGAAAPSAGRVPDPGQLMAALEGVIAERVLVVVGPDARIDVIPVRDHAVS